MSRTGHLTLFLIIFAVAAAGFLWGLNRFFEWGQANIGGWPYVALLFGIGGLMLFVTWLIDRRTDRQVAREAREADRRLERP